MGASADEIDEVKRSVWAVPLRDAAVVVAVTGLTTGLGLVAEGALAEADRVLLYMVAVALSAMFVGRGSAVMAALLSVVTFNFFFVEPRHTFLVHDSRYLLTFAVMTLAGVLTSATAAHLRAQAHAERTRAQRLDRLLALSQRLTGLSSLEAIGAGGAAGLQAVVGGRVQLRFYAGQRALGVWGVEDLPDAAVVTASGAGIRAQATLSDLAEDGGASLQVAQAALALVVSAAERATLDEAARRARLAVEVEKSRSDLLSSVSHDLRTPLALITGAQSALAAEPSALTREQRRALLTDIGEESARLARMLANLLAMTRLEDTGLVLAGDWHTVDDLLSSALHAARAAVAGRELRRVVPAEIQLVWCDPVLVEQALVNLIENAARHAPDGPIVAAVSCTEAEVTFEMTDCGPGFTDLERCFERFHRAGPTAGTGLGLAIARAVAVAHGGRIEAENRTDRGAVVRLRLPRGGPQAAQPPAAPEPEPSP